MSDRNQPAAELRERALLPILIPVVAILLVEVLVFSFSRVLLAAGKLPAVGVALAVALGILVVCAGIANAERIKTPTIVGLIVLGVLATVVAGAAAERKGPFYGSEPAESAAKGVEVSAKSLAFSTKTIELPASNAVIDFKNEDTQPHNIAIFKNKSNLNSPAFRGEIAPPGKTEVYKVGTLAAGVYYFHCDVHPTMSGNAVVK